MEVENEQNFNQESIANQYNIIDKIGSSDLYTIYLVQENNIDILYAAKVLKEDFDYSKYENEINILVKLSSANSENLEKIYNSGEGEIVLNSNSEIVVKKFLIVDYMPKGELINYIRFNQGGFNELFSKIIFEQILKGVKVCHLNGIYHNNINLENFLLNDDYVIKLYKFHDAITNSEIINNKINGIQYNIIQLAEILLSLVCNKSDFKKALKNNKILRKYYKSDDPEQFWNNLDKSDIEGLSKDLKDFLYKMIAYNPKEQKKILTIDELLEDKWFKELYEIKKNQKLLNELKSNLKKEFERREKFIKKRLNLELNASMYYVNNEDNRAIEFYKYFDKSVKTNDLKRKNLTDSYIKIKGNINPCYLMNLLCEKIKKIMKGQIIYKDNEYYKCNVTFEDENSNNDEEIDDDYNENDEDIEDDVEDINNNNNIINIKLYEVKGKDNYYLIKLKRKKGYMSDCMDKIEKIADCIKEIIKDKDENKKDK